MTERRPVLRGSMPRGEERPAVIGARRAHPAPGQGRPRARGEVPRAGNGGGGSPLVGDTQHPAKVNAGARIASTDNRAKTPRVSAPKARAFTRALLPKKHDTTFFPIFQWVFGFFRLRTASVVSALALSLRILFFNRG